MDKLVKKEVITLCVSQVTLILLAVACDALPLFMEFDSLTGTKAAVRLFALACIAALNFHFVVRRFSEFWVNPMCRHVRDMCSLVEHKARMNCKNGYFSEGETARCLKRYRGVLNWLGNLYNFHLDVFDCVGIFMMSAAVILGQVQRRELRFYRIYGVAGFIIVLQTAWLYVFSRYMFRAVLLWINRLMNAIPETARKPIPAKENPLTIKCGVVKECDLNASEVVIPDGVKKIGESAFLGCQTLVSVAIPKSVITIGERAFKLCKSLASVVMPENLRTIGESAFLDCQSLVSIAIPKSVKIIDESAFWWCILLTEIRFDGTMAQWEEVKKVNCWHYRTPAACVKCSDGDVPLPQYLVEDGVLEEWYRVDTEAVIPAGVKKIEGRIFLGCSYLTSVAIPDSVTEIGNWAFAGTSLTSLTIPNSVVKIGWYTFGECTALTEIRFDGTVTQWLAVRKDMDWCHSTPAKVVHCSDGDVPLPPYLVEDGVLERWHRADTEAVIPVGVVKIKNDAFLGCSYLTSVAIPNSVTEIDYRAFTGTSLTSLTIPSSVVKIGWDAFCDCTALTEIRFDGTKAQWMVVKKGKDWCRYTPAKVVQCTDGDVPL